MNTKLLTLYQKLLILQKECNYLKKENKGYQFQYVSSSQTLGTIRGKMDELGILLIPKVTGHNIIEFENQKGNHEFLTEMDIEYTWINAEAPDDVLVCPFYGQGVDNAEKGVGKALTYAEKYFILKFFHIATDKDDPDSYQSKHNDDLVPAENAAEFHRPENNLDNPPKNPPVAKTQSQATTDEPMISATQSKLIFAKTKNDYGIDDNNERKRLLSRIIGRTINSSKELTRSETSTVIDMITNDKPVTDGHLAYIRQFPQWAPEKQASTKGTTAADVELPASQSDIPF